jgi:hypothetical protein
MANCTKEAVRSQVQFELEELESSKGLPFRDLLSKERIQAALNRAGITFRNRVYTPMVTLYAFLSQVTSQNDSSCKDAVSRVVADRAMHNQKECSPETASYCEARARLPEEFFSDLARETGQELHRQSRSEWLWKERHVVIVDGSTATMTDSEENQKEYPQTRSQKAGLGFPILRFVVLLSLATGGALECVIGPCRGKKTGEQNLFRQTWEALETGDIVLGDRLYDAYRDIALLRARGVDVVFGKKQSRHSDFRSGRKLGKNDHLVIWKRPKYIASRYESKEEWASLPEEMEMREIRIVVRRKGYRSRTIVVVTTLLDADTYSAKDVTDLFAQRWHCELDLRSIKRCLGMHHLHCCSPEMVRKELWTHLLAYNLIRVRMAQAAAVHNRIPRTLSFSDTKKLMNSFAVYLEVTRGAERQRIEDRLIAAIARSRVGNRPGRKEPRAVKKRPTKYAFLTKPRVQARKGLAA